MKRRTIIAASAFALAASAGALAAIGSYGEPKFARNVFARIFTDLNFPPSTMSISKIGSDSANNIWFSTEGGGLGAVKLSGDNLAKLSAGFPINKANYSASFKLSDYLSAVVFARFGNENYFFFSSDDTAGNAGLQWGRFTDRVDLKDPLFLDGVSDVLVYDLATDGSKHLWAATEKGVYDIDLAAEEIPQATKESPHTYQGYSGAANEVGGIIDVSSLTGTPGAVYHTRFNSSIGNSAKYLFYLNPENTP
ncbi:hypothetical protein FDZ71_02535, partial [bacterium]